MLTPRRCERNARAEADAVEQDQAPRGAANERDLVVRAYEQDMVLHALKQGHVMRALERDRAVQAAEDDLNTVGWLWTVVTYLARNLVEQSDSRCTRST